MSGGRDVPPGGGPRVREPRTLREILASHERVLIIEALARSGGSRTRAAASLGMRRERLYARVRALRIDLGAVEAAVGRPRRGGGGA